MLSTDLPTGVCVPPSAYIDTNNIAIVAPLMDGGRLQRQVVAQQVTLRALSFTWRSRLNH